MPADFGSLVKCQMFLSLRFCFLSPRSKCRGKRLLHPVVGEFQVGPDQADDHTVIAVRMDQVLSRD